MTTYPCPDDIADCVLNRFNALPSKFKPRVLANGGSEWVTLAGIVLSRDRTTLNRNTVAADADHLNTKTGKDENGLLCAALATGVKCLPYDKVVQAQGNILHDSHAEILAIRAFNGWLVDECADLARKGIDGQHAWLKWSDAGRKDAMGDSEDVKAEGQDGMGTDGYAPFELHEDVAIHMYISEAPCGDASMELTMAEQEDATPWASPTHPTPSPTTSESEASLLGRGHFDQLGIVRRKPARPDAPISWSKSCSDKLAMKQCTSLLSALTSRIVRPGNAYLSTLVLPTSQLVPNACERAFGAKGRMAAVMVPKIQQSWSRTGHRFSGFEVRPTVREFAFSRSRTRLMGQSQASAATPSNLAAVATSGQAEILINGVRQGRKQFDRRGASRICRRSMWAAVLEVAILAGLPTLVLKMRAGQTYREAKFLEGRSSVKRDAVALALNGWSARRDDDGWTLAEPATVELLERK